MVATSSSSRTGGAVTDVAANARRPGKPARLAPPTQGRGEAWLLLGPAAFYLIVFSIYPLITSLDPVVPGLQPDQEHVELDRAPELPATSFSSSEFWQVVKNTVIFTGAGVAIQVVLGTALALFFNQNLRGSAIVRGILILPMLLTPIVVGLMWRALLNPQWGLLNWVAVKLGFGYVGWLSDSHVALWTLILVDSWQWTPFVFVDRLRAPAGAAAGGVRGRLGRRRQLVPAHSAT